MSTGTDLDTAVHDDRAARHERLLDVVGLVVRLFLGAVLLYAGLVKVGHPLTAERAVQAYDIFPLGMGGLIGQALPFLEIVLGVLLLLGLFTRPVAAVAAVLMFAFIVGIAQAWARGLTIDCGCFGGGGTIAAAQTHYLSETLRDVGLALCAAWLVVRPRTAFSLDRRLF